MITLITAYSQVSLASPLFKYQRPSPPKVIEGTYHIRSGTGFFINPNYIVTNEHVVQDCKEISARGSIEPTVVTLEATDVTHDLALLKSYRTPITTALLSNHKHFIQGAPITVIGYPEEHARTGKYHISKGILEYDATQKYNASITQRLLFSNVVRKGNSGGPLLDANGNVAGIVLGAINFFRIYGDDPDNPPTEVDSYGIATDTNTLKNFLEKQKVSYRTDTTYYQFADHWVEKKARQFIVNISCREKK